MRIVFDARMARWTGVGRYITGLFSALPEIDRDMTFLTLINPGDDTSWIPAQDRFEAIETSRPIRPYSVREQISLKRELLRHEPDLIHVPHFNVPRMGFQPLVTTIHDLIYLLFPQDAPSRIAWWGARRMIRSAVKRSRRILAVSQNTKNDIVRLLQADPDKISVTHLGPPPERAAPESVPAVTEKLGVARPFMLYTGNHSPHKNLNVLVDALGRLVRSGRDLRLAITGPLDRHTPAVSEYVARRGLSDRVVFTGKVPDDELFALYAGAAVLVFPSLYEGFGIPPLEAFAHDIPVVASNAASIPEVLADAALLVDPKDPAAFENAVARVLDDDVLRDRLIAKGRDRLTAFSWAKTARSTLDAYEAAVNGG